MEAESQALASNSQSTASSCFGSVTSSLQTCFLICKMGIMIALSAIGCPQRCSEADQAHVHTYFCSVPSLIVCLVAWGLRVRFCCLLASPRVLSVCVCGPYPRSHP